MHHYLTRYEENGVWYAEAWLQINLFGRCFCFSKRKMEIEGPAESGRAKAILNTSILNPRITKITVLDLITGTELAVISDNEIEAASSDLVVKITPKYDETGDPNYDNKRESH